MTLRQLADSVVTMTIAEVMNNGWIVSGLKHCLLCETVQTIWTNPHYPKLHLTLECNGHHKSRTFALGMK